MHQTLTPVFVATTEIALGLEKQIQLALSGGIRIRTGLDLLGNGYWLPEESE